MEKEPPLSADSCGGRRLLRALTGRTVLFAAGIWKYLAVRLFLVLRGILGGVQVHGSNRLRGVAMRERAKKEKCVFSSAIPASMPFASLRRALLPVKSLPVSLRAGVRDELCTAAGEFAFLIVRLAAHLLTHFSNAAQKTSLFMTYTI